MVSAVRKVTTHVLAPSSVYPLYPKVKARKPGAETVKPGEKSGKKPRKQTRRQSRKNPKLRKQSRKGGWSRKPIRDREGKSVNNLIK